VWRDHLPRSSIVGLDISEKAVNLGPRVRFVRGDQSVPEDLDRAVAALGRPPDIVIDDGSHLAHHARASFEHLFPLMPSGSVYFIEDLHTSYWDDYGGAVPAPPESAIGFLKSLIDRIESDDRVFGWFPDLPAPDAPSLGIERLDLQPGVAAILKR